MGSFLELSQKVYFDIRWDGTFPDHFPVTFAVKDCSVEEVGSGAAFDVLKNGCLADLVSAEKYELGKNEGPKILIN